VKRGQDPKHNSTNIRFSRDLLSADKVDDIIDLVGGDVVTDTSDSGSVDNGVHSSSPLQKPTSFKRVYGAVVLRAISTSSTAIVPCVGAKHAVVHPQTERSSLEKSKPFREE
jgi:hypothetical protein